MHSSLFFKLFPTPKFLAMRHVGLDISDDAIRCIEYEGRYPEMRIIKHACLDLPKGMIEEGDVKDEQSLIELISKFDKENDFSYAKISVPEEKSYLFQTDIPSTDPLKITQNVEFKIEENVPLSASDAVFYFDILPMQVTGNVLRASVSVVPRSYIEKIANIMRRSGIYPVAFEVVPKAIAKSIIPPESSTAMIIHVMNYKTGIYIVSGGVVCATFTLSCGTKSASKNDIIDNLKREISKVYDFWISHSKEESKITKVFMVGSGSKDLQSEIAKTVSEVGLSVSLGNVWTNSFSLEKYVPPISESDSLDYAVASGLAMKL
jgi:Tfp pilus assembly PilM family ATPase